ncbi:uncharacterized protein LOC130452010 [Diorhabda sublineata]|uniref:uncharacterized protein LOC130447096 n=1 Tax=Diorhabda sublineata TaxID=1163346 RepID=UPI0024E17EA4|nr:uncharacterized protein LOC130447096 [Diorhabda sublineata]XP_056647347.1 uncharacterized protein LOC130452010 [Diorhabda sublineata]
MISTKIIIFGILVVSISSSSPVVNGRNGIFMPFSETLDTVENVITNVAKSKAVTPVAPDSGRTKAVLESLSRESLPLQIDNKYGNLQEFVANIFKPQPIVDTSREYEKYGNDAEKSRKLSTAIIAGYEGFSNILNTAVEVPFIKAKQFGKTLTTSLNTIGDKLVGLS